MLPGLAAVALFLVLAAVFLRAPFAAAEGFPDGIHVTAEIGYALFNIPAGDVPTEGFLAAFFIIAIVLDAALDGALLLARQEVDRLPDHVTTERRGEEDVGAEGRTRSSERAPGGGDD